MHHKTALNKDSRHSLIKSSKEGTKKTQVLTNNSNSLDMAIRIIKSSIGSKGSFDLPLVFQIGKDEGLYQIIDLKGTWFHRYRRIL